MSRLRIIGLALVAAFAISAVAASAASAQVWEEEAPAGSGMFTPITVAKEVTSKTSGAGLALKDGGTGVTVTCEGTNKGFVGPGNKDEITSITATKCKSSSTFLCPEPVTATAVGLPWVTVLEGSPIRDKITSKNGAVVGWLVKCNNGQTDECTAASSSTAMTNNAGGTVTATFDASTPKANCSKGGAGKGTVTGSDVNTKVSAGGIRVK